MKCSIVVTRYSESDKLVKDCLGALSKQKNITCEVNFLDQRDSKEIYAFCKEMSNKNIKINYIKIPAKTLSYARNYGIKISKASIILFTDSDAIVDENWAKEIFKTFSIDKKIAIVGGTSKPKWPGKLKWYHKSNIVKELYSLISLSDEITPVEKVVGVNFAINKDLLGDQALFNENLGRKPGSLLGGEETDLCSKVGEKGFLVYYNPKAIIHHQIQEERMSLRWVLKRMYYGGVSRAARGGKPKTFHKERNIYDRIILPILLVPYIIGYIMEKLRK